MNNIPCICGHEKEAHYYLVGACSNISYPFSSKRHACGCSQFKRFTNLEWLEAQYEKEHS